MAQRTLRDPDALIEAGLAPESARADINAVNTRYAIAVTPEMAAQIDPTDPHDPIAAQFVPDPRELNTLPEELADPIGDEAHSPVPGIVHRYPDRALLKVVQVCPVYCRFCFRRESVGPQHGGTLPRAELDQALAYLRDHPEIWEVILTGGDPMILSPARMRHVMEKLAEIGHIKVVRLHTRVPVVAPAHVDDALIAALKSAGKAVYVALHANHPKEFTPNARAAIARLVDAGIPMLSQSVLLRGINDDLDTLTALMRSFVEMRIKPYHLNHGDLAPGTAHFRTSIAEGRKLVGALRGRLSGLCQFFYVLDIPGGAGKAVLNPDAIEAEANGELIIRDWRGGRHAYRDSLSAD